MSDLNEHSELLSSFREPDGHSNAIENGEVTASSSEDNPDEQQYLNLIERIIANGKLNKSLNNY